MRSLLRHVCHKQKYIGSSLSSCNKFSTLSSNKLNSDKESAMIDISTFLASDPSKRTVQQHEDLIDELIDVSSKVGFFYVTGFNNIVSEQLISSTFDQLKLFFDLPLEEKMKIHVSKTKYLRGYMAHGEQGYYGLDDTDKRLDVDDTDSVQKEREQKDLITDMKEVFTMGTELDLNHKYFNDLLFGPNIFPDIDILPNFNDTINKYYDSVLELSDHLYQLLAIALNRNSTYFDDKITEGMNSMNCIHYMPLPKEQRVSNIQFGIGEHTDYECFTLLAQDINSPSGLEVFMNDGNWRRFEPVKNTFVVNFGDIMARFSNDMFRSTVHRAVNDPVRSRYSIAFFRHCDFDIKVSNLKTDEIAKYKPVIAGEHMLDRVERANQPCL
eukprot:64730_1